MTNVIDLGFFSSPRELMCAAALECCHYFGYDSQASQLLEDFRCFLLKNTGCGLLFILPEELDA